MREDYKAYLEELCEEWSDTASFEVAKEEGINLMDHKMKFLGTELRDGKTVWRFDCPLCCAVHEVEKSSTMDWVYVGEGPSEEENLHRIPSRITASTLIGQLRRTIGKEPENARLSSRYEGEYYTVVCYYQENDPMAYAYALMCEDRLPKKWSAKSQEIIKSAMDVL